MSSGAALPQTKKQNRIKKRETETENEKEMKREEMTETKFLYSIMYKYWIILVARRQNDLSDQAPQVASI